MKSVDIIPESTINLSADPDLSNLFLQLMSFVYLNN